MEDYSENPRGEFSLRIVQLPRTEKEQPRQYYDPKFDEQRNLRNKNISSLIELKLAEIKTYALNKFNYLSELNQQKIIIQHTCLIRDMMSKGDFKIYEIDEKIKEVQDIYRPEKPELDN